MKILWAYLWCSSILLVFAYFLVGKSRKRFSKDQQVENTQEQGVKAIKRIIRTREAAVKPQQSNRGKNDVEMPALSTQQLRNASLKRNFAAGYTSEENKNNTHTHPRDQATQQRMKTVQEKFRYRTD